MGGDTRRGGRGGLPGAPHERGFFRHGVSGSRLSPKPIEAEERTKSQKGEKPEVPFPHSIDRHASEPPTRVRRIEEHSLYRHLKKKKSRLFFCTLIDRLRLEHRSEQVHRTTDENKNTVLGCYFYPISTCNP